jgi:hypothetical protein
VPDIVRKLESELQQKIVSEPQVVYILVQSRKLIDDKKKATNFEALKLYCDWVMHTQLYFRPAERLMDKLNICHPLGLHPVDQAQKEKDFSSFFDELTLDRFRDQFRVFLASEGLPENVCDEGRWSDFLQHYSSIIQDCPLTYQPQKSSRTSPTKQFDKVILTKIGAAEGEQEGKISLLNIRWEFYFESKLVQQWEINQSGDKLSGSILASK